jgi:hypothetical protein
MRFIFNIARSEKTVSKFTESLFFSLYSPQVALPLGGPPAVASSLLPLNPAN